MSKEIHKTEDAYNRWSKTYDTVDYKTRDLEAKAIRSVLDQIYCSHIIEISCGTGKNTSWLAQHCEQLTAVDFSKEMLNQARQKIKDHNAVFEQAASSQPWKWTRQN